MQNYLIAFIASLVFFKAAVFQLAAADTRTLVEVERICRLSGSEATCAVCLPEQGYWEGHVRENTYAPEIQTSSYKAKALSCQQFYSYIDMLQSMQELDTQVQRPHGKIYQGEASQYMVVRMKGVSRNLHLSKVEFDFIKVEIQSQKQILILHFTFLVGFLLYTIASVWASKPLWKILTGLSGILLFVPVQSVLVTQQLKFPALLMLLMSKQVKPLFSLIQVLAFLVIHSLSPLYSLVVLVILIPLNYMAKKSQLFIVLILIVQIIPLALTHFELKQLAKSAFVIEKLMMGLMLVLRDDEEIALLESHEVSEDQLASVV